MADRRPPPEDDAPLSDEERRLFESEMRDVRRIDSGPRRTGDKPKPPPIPKRLADGDPAAGLAVEAAGEHLSAFDPSVSSAVRRALRRGDTPPEAVLDLHGARAAQARTRVEAFVQGARRSGQRCVLLITGRGLRSGPAGPVLRDEVLALLTEGSLRPAVLGIVSAPPSLGGPGALLLLLRKA